jgi:hypothetical protein
MMELHLHGRSWTLEMIGRNECFFVGTSLASSADYFLALVPRLESMETERQMEYKI